MPSNSVGGVSVSVNLDDRDALKQLDNLRRKMAGLEDALNAKRAQKDSVAAQLRIAGADADAARMKVEELKAALAAAAPGDRAGLRAQLTAANAELREQTSIVNKLDDQYVKLTNEINAGERDLARMGSSTADLERQIAAGSGAMAKFEDAAANAAKRFDKVFSRIGNMIKRVFFFSVITRALRGIRTWFTDIIASNDEAAAAIGRFKGALLTLVQPLVEVIVPAITALVNALTKVVLAIASFTSGLFGKTVQESAAAAESFQEEQNAIKGVGGAAKKASGQLAAFDQINKLAAEDAGSGSGSNQIQPIFEFDPTAEDELNNLLRIIEAIGSALLAWKIGSALGMGLKEILWLALLLYSTLEFIRDFFDAWNNGITLDNLKNMLLELAGMAAGAALAFGKLGAGIALVLGGLALLALGFKDLYENGMDLENTLAIIAGLFAAGLGLSILTGSWIPLALAALASLVLALIYTQGEGELFTEGIRDIFDGLGQFFKAIFAGDVEAAMEGLKQAWEGCKKVAQAVENSLEKIWTKFLDWLDTTLGPNWRSFFEGLDEFFTGIFAQDMKKAMDGLNKAAEALSRGIQEAWKKLLSWLNSTLGPNWKAFFEGVGNVVAGALNFITGLLNGLIKFITGVFAGDWKKAWEGLCDIGKGTVNGLIQLLEGFVNSAIAIINGLIGLINKIKLDINIPDWVPGIGGKRWTLAPNISEIGYLSLPRLAQGAVIPPNREFMAVLGDQKSGTNIEAPLETIVAAFRQAIGEMRKSGDQNVEVRVFLDSREIRAGQERLARVTGGASR